MIGCRRRSFAEECDTVLAIVIPAYKAAFLGRTLASIAAQTDRHFVVYVGDDASPHDLADLAPASQGQWRCVTTGLTIHELQEMPANGVGVRFVQKLESGSELTIAVDAVVALSVVGRDRGDVPIDLIDQGRVHGARQDHHAPLIPFMQLGGQVELRPISRFKARYLGR